MREIKFRAWDNEEKQWYAPTHEAYKGDLFELFVSFGGDLCAHTMHGMEHESVWPKGKFTLMQFTGLKDKNGKEIYEGDIVDTNGKGNRVIAWHIGNMGFILDAEPDKIDGQAARFSDEALHKLRERGFAASLAVIGNIYENPELLKA